MAIIVLFIGIAAPQLINQFTDARSDSARVGVSSIANSVDMFFVDVGRYPTEAEGLDALITAPSGATGWNGPYISRASSLTDPWGTAYSYALTGTTSQPFTVSTLGSDGTAGGSGEAADITNWD